MGDIPGKNTLRKLTKMREDLKCDEVDSWERMGSRKRLNVTINQALIRSTID